ncbi:MAG: DNA translocase FtsK 4TM domain-containing protein, partial [Cyclobacteriaceae bacterium]|nr:DNA translocase FtsK 4TM domain-containing protein [Cyclobacteriaceae bacterium]
MTGNTYKNTFKKPGKKKEKKRLKLSLNFLEDKRFQLVSGFFLQMVSIYFITAFISYLFTGKADQSVVEAIRETGWIQSGLESDNWLGAYGAIISHFFIFQWFGISAFFIPPLLFIWGYRVVFNRSLFPSGQSFLFVLFFTLWISLLLGYIVLRVEGSTAWSFLSGGLGYYLARLFNSLVGWGTFLLLVFSLLAFIIYFFNITSLLMPKKEEMPLSENEESDEENVFEQNIEEGNEEIITGDEDELSNWTVSNKEDVSKKKVITDEKPTLELDVEVAEPEQVEEQPELE